MKIAGILSVVCVVLSFLLWTANWIVSWFFASLTVAIPWTSSVLWVVGFCANLLELLAILMAAIGLIISSKKLKQS